jgi:hypothetical protein
VPFCILLLPISLSAQVTLTPMEVRRANVLLDDCERVHDELKDAKLEIQRNKEALAVSLYESAIAASVISVKDTAITAAKHREMVLVNTLAKSGRVTKRRERLLWIVGTVAVVEAVAIGVAYGLR